MWRSTMLTAIVVSVVMSSATASESLGPTAIEMVDVAALSRRVAELERALAEVQRDLKLVRQQLDAAQASAPKAKALSPQEAVEAFKRQPDRPVTVEFGVERGADAVLSGLIRAGEDPIGPMRLVWDNRLAGGGEFVAYLPPKVYRRLKGFAPADERAVVEARAGEMALDPLRSRVARHIEVNGIRVTGLIKESGFGGYYITVERPEDVVTYIKGSGE